MQTITFKELKKNIDSLYLIYNKETTVVKNEQNQVLLLLPMPSDNWEEYFLNLSKSFGEKKNEIEFPKKQMTGENFVAKWSGILKDTKVSENWKDDYYDYLMEKYK